MMVARRGVMGMAAVVVMAVSAAGFAAAPPVEVHFLEGSPAVGTGVAFGLPYAKGAVQKGEAFGVQGGQALQSWPLAYWPDGSVKWMGFAGVSAAGMKEPLVVTSGAVAASAPVLTVTDSDTSVNITAGTVSCHISKSGTNLFDTMSVGGAVVAKNGRIDCIVQKGAETDAANPPARERFVSSIKKVTVEQNGPVRAVVKIEGMEKSVTGTREFLPFVVRLYFLQRWWHRR